MIVENTQHIIILSVIYIIFSCFGIYLGLKKDNYQWAKNYGYLVGIVMSIILFYSLTTEPYQILPEIQKVILNEIPETSQYFHYQTEEGEVILQYLDDSYSVQTARMDSENLKIQFKDDIKEPYMEYQKAETFFGKDLGLYKVDIYLPK